LGESAYHSLLFTISDEVSMIRRLSLAGVLVAGVSATALAQGDPEAKLKEMGITLPEVGKPLANYVPSVRTGNLVFLSGHGPAQPWGPTATGKLGRDLTVEQGYQAAKNVGINLLASLRAEIGSLKKVKRIVKVLGMVNSAEGFGQQPEVINGFSDLMVAVFGDRGKHARSAVGMAALPRGMSVEIEMVVEVEP
jgi:enamine deaminase RidA (YjgF/YER057c/UK114 family)